jgi:uncharacterized lipoprotein YajG
MHNRKIAVILTSALLAACQASPTDSTGTTKPGARRLDGFTMGSGNVVQTPPENGAATTTNAAADSVTERGGFTMGSGN